MMVGVVSEEHHRRQNHDDADAHEPKRAETHLQGNRFRGWRWGGPLGFKRGDWLRLGFGCRRDDLFDDRRCFLNDRRRFGRRWDKNWQRRWNWQGLRRRSGS